MIEQDNPCGERTILAVPVLAGLKTLSSVSKRVFVSFVERKRNHLHFAVKTNKMKSPQVRLLNCPVAINHPCKTYTTKPHLRSNKYNLHSVVVEI